MRRRAKLAGRGAGRRIPAGRSLRRGVSRPAIQSRAKPGVQSGPRHRSACLSRSARSVSYALDIFGGITAQCRGAGGAGRSSAITIAVAAAYLALSGNIATQAINGLIAGLRAQIEGRTRGQSQRTTRKNLRLVKMPAGRRHGDDKVDVTTAQTRASPTTATLLPPLRQQLAVARDALTVFVGKTPGEWSPPDFDLAALHHLPPGRTAEPAVGDGAAAARHSRRRGASSMRNAALVWRSPPANLYPNFTLNASMCCRARPSSAISSPASTPPSTSAQTWRRPIFHGGTPQAQQRAAVDAFDAAWAAYRPDRDPEGFRPGRQTSCRRSSTTTRR